MTLLELSLTYADSAARIFDRMQELHRQAQAQQDPEQAKLLPLWRDMLEMTRCTAHYYDRGYRR